MKGYLIVVSAVTIVIPSIQHYVPPPDMCMLAQSCNHTWVPECGIDGNSSTRLFLDNCDMYEYNCDNYKDYTKIATKECPQNCTKSENLKLLLNYATEHTKSTHITSTITTPTSTMTTPMMADTQTSTIASHATETTISTTASMTTDSTSNLAAISETIISLIPIITSTVGPVIETAPRTTIVSTTLNTTNSTTISSTTISTESTSDSSCTASTYPESQEELSDHDCYRKSIPEISSTKETMESTIKVNQTTETAAETTLTESNITPQIIEITSFPTTHINSSPLTETVISTDNATEIIQTTITGKSETTTEFTTALVNVTSITMNQTNVEDITTAKNTSLPLNIECSHYPKDCNRPVTWETTAEGETRDFYQILKQRFGNRVSLLRDTTHWPRKSALNIGDKMKAFLFGNHNDIK